MLLLLSRCSELERRVMELEGQLSDAQAKEDKDKGFKGWLLDASVANISLKYSIT